MPIETKVTHRAEYTADSNTAANIGNPAIHHQHLPHIDSTSSLVCPTHRRTTSHCSQQTRSGIFSRLVLTTAQPRHGNDLLHCLTGNPVSGGCSGIGANDLFHKLLVSIIVHIFGDTGDRRRTMPPWNRKARVVVPWASLMGQLGFEWSSVMARRKAERWIHRRGCN